MRMIIFELTQNFFHITIGLNIIQLYPIIGNITI